VRRARKGISMQVRCGSLQSTDGFAPLQYSLMEPEGMHAQKPEPKAPLNYNYFPISCPLTLVLLVTFSFFLFFFLVAFRANTPFQRVPYRGSTLRTKLEFNCRPPPNFRTILVSGLWITCIRAPAVAAAKCLLREISMSSWRTFFVFFLYSSELYVKIGGRSRNGFI